MFVVVLNLETSEQQKKFIPRKFHKKPSVQKLCDLMVCKSKKQRLKTAKFFFFFKEFRE